MSGEPESKPDTTREPHIISRYLTSKTSHNNSPQQISLVYVSLSEAFNPKQEINY